VTEDLQLAEEQEKGTDEKNANRNSTQSEQFTKQKAGRRGEDKPGKNDRKRDKKKIDGTKSESKVATVPASLIRKVEHDRSIPNRGGGTVPKKKKKKSSMVNKVRGT